MWSKYKKDISNLFKDQLKNKTVINIKQNKRRRLINKYYW
jgi:hypothetical protein